MKISVILPTYKPQSYLWECLSSIERQTLPKDFYEVIIVLNGCKEPYLSKITNYCREYLSDVQIRIIQIDEGGVSLARNMALDIVQGDFITFIDDDDIISNNYLEELLNHSDSEGCVGVCRIVAFRDAIYNQLYTIPQDYNRYIAPKECKQLYRLSSFFSGPTVKLFHRSIIGNRRFDINFRNGEDALFNFLVSDKITRVSFASPNAVYYRRVRDGSASTASYNTQRYRINNCIHLIQAFSRIYVKNPLKYSFLFYVTRILATIKGLLYNIF